MEVTRKLSYSFLRKITLPFRLITRKFWNSKILISHAYFTSGLYDLVEDSFYDRKGDFLNFLKTIKAKDAAPGTSNFNATAVPPSTAQSTNVPF